MPKDDTRTQSRTAPSHTEEAFHDWRQEVSRLCLQRWGLTLDDLPDLLTRDAFDADLTPEEFFEDDVMEVVQLEFGSLAECSAEED